MGAVKKMRLTLEVTISAIFSAWPGSRTKLSPEPEILKFKNSTAASSSRLPTFVSRSRFLNRDVKRIISITRIPDITSGRMGVNRNTTTATA